MRDVSVIVFDMDGVVVDSESLHEQAQYTIFKQFGLDVPRSALTRFKGKTEEDVFYTIIREFASEPLDVSHLIHLKHETFRSLHDQLRPVKGALFFIKKAAETYRLALTTSATKQDQERAFEKFGLGPYFDIVVTKEDITRPKPDPEPYLVTIERLDVEPSSCLVVEDSVNGICSALAAGCRVAAITTSFDAPILSKTGAHLTVASFDDLARSLCL